MFGRRIFVETVSIAYFTAFFNLSNSFILLDHAL